jgi:hypothetical protein
MDPHQARVVEMRFFGGLSVEETAEVLKISSQSVTIHDIGSAAGMDFTAMEYVSTSCEESRSASLAKLS